MGVRELLLAAALLHVSVAQEPTLTLMPSGILLKALDGAVYVSCKAEVEDPALITQMKWSGPNGEEIPNQDGSIITLDNPASPGTLDLYVQKLQEKDVGTYKCTASYAGNKELSSEIKVESYMDIDFGDTALHQTPIDGTDSKIFCTVTANPTPTVDWLKDMKPIRLDDRHIIQQDGILIKQISEDDEGVYRCRAKVPELGSIEYKDIKVEVYSPPEIIEAPENVTGVEKKGASFNCVASGKPSPTYTWVDKDSRPLEDAEGYNVDKETGTLTVLELGPQHTGTYRCTASNAAGDVTKEAFLQVLTKPKIESYLNITVDIDNDVEMRCVATGDPLPELVFKKESNEAVFINGINEDSRIDISQEVDDQGRAVGVMKIRDLQRTDDGLYTCTGDSPGGETQAWGHITAQFTPTFEEQTFTEVWTWDQKPINISCIATSIPNATVQWYLRSKEIEAEDANFKVISAGPTGVLQVNPVDNSYFGVYTCQAQNLIGTSDFDIDLKQAEAPDAVSNVKAEKITATTITWSIMDPHNDGGRPIQGYNMEYRLDDTTWDDAQTHFWTKGSEYSVERLTPDMTYIFRFSARNEVGNSVWGGEQSETMPKRAAPEEPEFSDLGEGVNEIAYPDHYIMQWTSPLDNGEPIDNFQVIYYQMKNVSGKLEKTEDSTTEEIEHPGPTTYKLEDLVPNTIYKVELRAHNVIGYSLPAEGIFKTAYGVRAADAELLFNFDEIIVNPNEKVQLDCGIQGEMRYCVWEKENEIYQVQDVYEGVYSGMGQPENTEGNQCGITVEQATIEDHGMWTCKIYIRGTALQGTKNVIITVKPTQAEVSPQLITANADDQQDVECSVMAARPAVKINWMLNGRDITSEAQAEERPTNPDGTYMTLSTLSHVFKAEENGQNLECVVAHHTLAEPEITNVPLTVVYAPIQKQVQTFYQIPIHSDYEIKLDFSANPRPTSLEWSYGPNFQEMPNTIEIPSDGKFATSLTDLENGNFQAVLKIVGITEENFDTKFKLHVANDIGEANYRVMLSRDEKPIDDEAINEIMSGPESKMTESKPLSGGAIAAIVVVLLLIVVVIGAAGFARYKQMFCFAPAAAASDEENKDIKEEHDTESARHVTPNPASNLINRLQQFIKPKKEQDQKLEKMEEGDADDGDEKALKEEGGKNSPRELSPDDKKESKEEKKEKEKSVESLLSKKEQKEKSVESLLSKKDQKEKSVESLLSKKDHKEKSVESLLSKKDQKSPIVDKNVKKSPKSDKNADKNSPAIDKNVAKSPKIDKPEVWLLQQS